MSSFARTTNHIADQFKDSASTARSSLADLGAQAMRLLNTASEKESIVLDSALEYMGLQRRQSAIRPILLFTAGAVVAGTAALLLTPTTGKRLRTQLLDFLGAVPNELEKRVDAALSDSPTANKIASTVSSVTDKVNTTFDRVPRQTPPSSNHS